MKKIEIQARQEDAGSRIDRALGRLLYPDYSRSYLTCMIEAGTVRVNQARVRKSYRLAADDTITLELEDGVRETPQPEDLPLRIIFEDEHIVVIDKPDGMIIHPGIGIKSGTLVNALLYRYPEIARVGIVFRPGVVHRLDKDTSGVLLAARTNLARYHLVEQFKNRKVLKEYNAIVVGDMPYDSDYVDLPIGKDKNSPEKMRVIRKGGKPASTYYEVQERIGGFTKVKVLPHTGRTHQIRVHLGHLGFPVVADNLYCKEKGQRFWNFVDKAREAGHPAPGISRHALHAERITFTHPTTGKEVTFSSPLPDDMTALLDWLRVECGKEND